MLFDDSDVFSCIHKRIIILHVTTERLYKSPDTGDNEMVT